MRRVVIASYRGVMPFAQTKVFDNEGFESFYTTGRPLVLQPQLTLYAPSDGACPSEMSRGAFHEHIYGLLSGGFGGEAFGYVPDFPTEDDPVFNMPNAVPLSLSCSDFLYFGSKINQRRILEGKVNMPPGIIGDGGDFDNEYQNFDKGDGVVVASEYSMGGSGVRRVKDPSLAKVSGPYVMTTWIEHEVSPNICGMVGEDGEVLLFPPTEQIIENGLSYRGSRYPLRTTESARRSMEEQAIVAARALASRGFYGYFGCDFLVNGDACLIEINPRLNGNSALLHLMMEHSRPSGTPGIASLLEGVYKRKSIEGKLWDPPGMAWEFRRELGQPGKVTEYIEPVNEAELFDCGGEGIIAPMIPGITLKGPVDYKLHLKVERD